MAPDALVDLMLELERSGFGQAVRASIWVYPLANLLHVLGAALLVGAIAALDIAVLRRMPDAPAFARIALPLAAFGLLLQVLTGIVLLAAEASALVRNPAFQLKMLVLLLGLLNIALFHGWFRTRRQGGGFGGGFGGKARPFAAVSLAVWVVVLLAGRTIAYI